MPKRFRDPRLPQTEVALTVVVTGGAEIRSTPPGIECGGAATSCSAVFDFGERVLLVATGAGPALAEWTAPCAGFGRTCKLALYDESTAVAANGIASGETAFAVLLGGNSEDLAYGLALDPSGTIVVGGGFSGTITELGLTSINGTLDVLLAGVDPRTGALRWGEGGGGTGIDVALKVDASPTRIVVTGSSSSPQFVWRTHLPSPSGGPDAFLLALGPDRTPVIAQSGIGSGVDIGLAVGAGPGGVVAFGGADDQDSFLEYFSEDTPWNLEGIAKYEPIASTNDFITEMVFLPDGDLVVAGQFNGTLVIGDQTHTGAGGFDPWVARMDGLNGRVEWFTTFGGAGTESNNGLAVLPSGEVVVAGSASADFMAGSHPIIASNGGFDGWMAILDSAGTPIFAQGFGGPGTEVISDVTAGPNGEIYLAGRGTQVTIGSLGGDPGLGGEDAFVAKLAPETHVPQWLRVFGGPGSDFARDPTLGPGGELYVTGATSGPAEVGLEDKVVTHGGRDAFVLLISP